jgi:myosin heavy subunit
LTNEKLQQFFNHRMFILEQNIYKREGIEWNYIDFGHDLQPTIDLIEQPMGIMSILDEECLFPKATDESFIRKLTERHGNGKQPHFKTVRLQPQTFVCRHYAGDVAYDTRNWLVKNRDPTNENVNAVLAKSSNVILAKLFQEFTDRGIIATGGLQRKKGSQFITVSQRHRTQLNELIYQLLKTTPHFVRCIVPNDEKAPGVINASLVLNQLRCNGVLEGIRITRLGFPSRVTFAEFRQRYT